MKPNRPTQYFVVILETKPDQILDHGNDFFGCATCVAISGLWQTATYVFSVAQICNL
jgi:hypothetical protein